MTRLILGYDLLGGLLFIWDFLTPAYSNASQPAGGDGDGLPQRLASALIAAVALALIISLLGAAGCLMAARTTRSHPVLRRAALSL